MNKISKWSRLDYYFHENWFHKYIHRKLRGEDVKLARQLLKQHPDWSKRECVEQATSMMLRKRAEEKLERV